MTSGFGQLASVSVRLFFSFPGLDRSQSASREQGGGKVR